MILFRLPAAKSPLDCYARNRNEKEQSLSNPVKVESLGNKAVLEKRINIRASDYRFEDKKKYYNGYTNGQGKDKEGTIVKELIDMSAPSQILNIDMPSSYIVL